MIGDTRVFDAPKPPKREKRAPSPLNRNAPIRKQGKRASKLARFRKAYLHPAFCALIRWKGCIVRSCWRTPVDVCHRVSRGAGGTWQDCFGACREHHTESHTIGLASFEAKYRVNTENECAANVMEWLTMSKDD